jgi:CHAD domain-containing protein
MAQTSGTAGASIPREVELKYHVPEPARLRAWLAGDGLGALDGAEVTDERVVDMEDRYVDTTHGALERAGFGARLRREGSGPVRLTVKSVAHDRPGDGSRPRGATSRALSQRVEVEGPADDRLDADAWPPSAAQELVNELRGAARLHTLFTVRQRRHVRTIDSSEGVVQLSLDDVSVRRGGRTVGTFCVLEAEALDRQGGGLGRLAALLEESGLVRPEPRSKEELARELVREAIGHRAHRLPRVPKTPEVRSDDPLADAGRKVLRMHLARMLSHEAGTRSGEDIEELHKMRVATRRMRGAWRVFDGAYRPRLQRRYVRELRAVAAALGEVRDMDVQLQHLEAYRAALPEDGRAAIESLRVSWVGSREASRRRLVAMLDSRQYRDLVEDYLDFVETPGAGERAAQPGEPTLVRDTAGSRIVAAYERVRAYETALSWADVPTLHALRIEAKRLRYTLEYFAEVLPPSASRLIESVTVMQDHLGLVNDAHVASGILRQWLNLNAPRLSATSREAVGHYLDSREADIRRLRRTFRPIWRRVTGRAFRRTLGLAISQIG